MSLSLLVGNDHLKRQLSMEIARGLSHAYIIGGPPGSGKRTLARLLSAALVCRQEGAAPCLTCTGCKKAMAGIHIDIISAGGDKDPLRVARIRALRRDAYIKPNEAPRKGYILYQADQMTDAAQNVMLKLLEEGPAYAVFFLLTSNPDRLLETVRSRCELLTLSPVSLEETEAWLAQRFPEASPQARKEAAQHCGGILGKAEAELAGTSNHTKAEECAAELLQRLCSREPYLVTEFCVQLEQEKWDRDMILAMLDEFLLLLKDGMGYVCGADCGGSSLRRALVQQAAQSLPLDFWARSTELIQQLRRAADYNLGIGHLAGWLAVGLNSFA